MYFKDPFIDLRFSQADVVIFDLNGLLVDDEPLQLEATNSVLKRYDINITDADWIGRCVGRKPAEYLPSFLSKVRTESPDVDLLIKSKDLKYRELVLNSGPQLIRPGVIDLLDHINASAKSCALATSTTRDGVITVMKALGIDMEKYFTLVISGDQVKAAKPDPEIYNLARSIFGGSLSYLVFEDSAAGVDAAAAAGMSCIAVPNHFTRRQDLTKAIVEITDLTPNAIVTRR
jgi:HAD superfamily hydrolase (TIGR01509 family)